MVWDELAQYVAVASSEWLDALGLFGEPIARNFLHPSTLGSRFFTLLVYIHIFVPLAMLFLMWIHLQRLSRPRVPRERVARAWLGVDGERRLHERIERFAKSLATLGPQRRSVVVARDDASIPGAPASPAGER